MIKGKGYGQAELPSRTPAKATNEYEATRFAEHCGRVVTDLQGLPEEAEDFADSATSLVLRMMERAEKGTVTPKMRDALRNVEAGAERWMENER